MDIKCSHIINPFQKYLYTSIPMDPPAAKKSKVGTKNEDSSYNPVQPSCSEDMSTNLSLIFTLKHDMGFLVESLEHFKVCTYYIES